MKPHRTPFLGLTACNFHFGVNTRKRPSHPLFERLSRRKLGLHVHRNHIHTERCAAVGVGGSLQPRHGGKCHR